MKPKVLTVTANPAIDKVFVVPGFTEGKASCVAREDYYAGGKGINGARCLKKLGGQAVATGFYGKQTGTLLQKLLREENIRQDFVRIEDKTRINITILGSGVHRQTRILEAGPKVTVGEIKRFMRKYDQLLRGVKYVAVCGSLPRMRAARFYSALIRLAQSRGILTLLDTSGEALKEGLRASPDIVTPNFQEAEGVLGFKLSSTAKIKKAIGCFHRMGVDKVLLTAGRAGVYGSDGQNIWFVRAPELKAVTDVGCGDAFAAGFLHALSSGKDFKEATLRASAVAAAAALSPVPGDFDRSQLKKILPGLRPKRL